MSEPILNRIVLLDRALREVQETIYNRKRLIIPVSVRVPGQDAYQTPPIAPVVASRVSGAVSGSFDWAYTYYSTYTGKETPLSAALSDTATGEDLTITGERSLDPMMDRVHLYRKLQTEGADGYRLQGEVANPESGVWSVTANVQFVGENDRPLWYAYTLLTVCGVGWRLLKCKVAADAALTADDSIYWQLWLSRQADGASNHEILSSMHDTRNIGFQTNRPYILSPRVTPGGVPTDEFDLPLSENDRIDFNVRGIGAVTALPNLTVTLGLVHEEE